MDWQLERLCEVLHDAYEEAAWDSGWQTQDASRVPWADVPASNQSATRTAVVALLLELHRQGRLLQP